MTKEQRQQIIEMFMEGAAFEDNATIEYLQNKYDSMTDDELKKELKEYDQNYRDYLDF
jgi:hypothetical protein